MGDVRSSGRRPYSPLLPILQKSAALREIIASKTISKVQLEPKTLPGHGIRVAYIRNIDRFHELEDPARAAPTQGALSAGDPFMLSG